MNLNDFLILEKRIAQISSSIEVTFAFDVVKTKHTEDRKDFDSRGLDVSTLGYISNAEMSDFVNWFRREIAESIINGDIVHNTNFVIRSEPRQLSMVIIAECVSLNYWKLIIKTVFRETSEYKLKVYANQLVLEK
jgi:hypothetical protein